MIHNRLIIHKKCCANIVLLLVVLFTLGGSANAQRYLADYDSTLFIRDTVRPLVQRFGNLNISGYIQPQYQVAQSKGAPSYAGGNFSEHTNNRFMLRRARVKVDYLLPARTKSFPKAMFTFQFDATERGVFARDIFMRLYEPVKEKLSLTLGLVARPFGYEVNLSSAYRETPERGRMSQILMPTERDLGAMLTYEGKGKLPKRPVLKLDLGLFNGQGLVAPTDYDSYKDLISRLTLKPFALTDAFTLSGGLSYLNGGWMQATKYRYEMGEKNGIPTFVVDSSESNIGGKAEKNYYGADLQLAYHHGWGKTELRGEYWKGTQAGVAVSTTNPGALPSTPAYIRDFDGAFFYFLQNIINEHWEVVAKWDWYDPNRKVSGDDIGKAGTNLTPADIKFSTLGFGLTHYFSNALKVVAYYDRVRNEKTALAGYTGDLEDTIFTLRMQLRF